MNAVSKGHGGGVARSALGIYIYIWGVLFCTGCENDKSGQGPRGYYKLAPLGDE